MAVLALRIFPDPHLRKSADSVKFFNRDLHRTIESLIETMTKQPSGIGIAAPQVGISRRIAIVDVSKRIEGAERLILINPVILEMQTERLSREGCMSLPDYTGQLKRFEWIRVRWQDENGDLKEKTSVGIEAICIQHEVDHLNGQLFIDRVTSLKRDLIPRPGNFKPR